MLFFRNHEPFTLSGLRIEIAFYCLFLGALQRCICYLDVVEPAEERELRIDGAEDCAAERGRGTRRVSLDALDGLAYLEVYSVGLEDVLQAEDFALQERETFLLGLPITGTRRVHALFDASLLNELLFQFVQI